MKLFSPDNPFRESNSYSASILGKADPVHVADIDEGGEIIQWVPPVDILENKTEYSFKLDVPGLRKNELRVLRVMETLVVMGARDLDNLKNKRRKFLWGCPRGYFIWRYTLPDDASREQIIAGLLDGVLQIVVRKIPMESRKKEYPERLEVKVN